MSGTLLTPVSLARAPRREGPPGDTIGRTGTPSGNASAQGSWVSAGLFVSGKITADGPPDQTDLDIS